MRKRKTELYKEMRVHLYIERKRKRKTRDIPRAREHIKMYIIFKTCERVNEQPSNAHGI